MNENPSKNLKSILRIKMKIVKMTTDKFDENITGSEFFFLYKW